MHSVQINQTVNDGVAHSNFTIPCYHISDDHLLNYDQEQF